MCSSIDSCDVQFLKKRPKRPKEAFLTLFGRAVEYSLTKTCDAVRSVNLKQCFELKKCAFLLLELQVITSTSFTPHLMDFVAKTLCHSQQAPED